MKWNLDGSYTVEAALIFPIVLYVILFLFYSAFYMNDRIVIQEAAYETALYGTTLNRTKTDQMKQKMQSKYTSAIKGRLIAMEEPACSIEVKNGYVTVTISGQMKTISMWVLPTYDGTIITAEKQAELWNPMDTLRINQLLEKEE